jgi:hypothetical protein
MASKRLGTRKITRKINVRRPSGNYIKSARRAIGPLNAEQKAERDWVLTSDFSSLTSIVTGRIREKVAH